MITAFLATTGGRVQIPDAVAMIDGEAEDEVQFVSRDGTTLVVFKRADLAVVTQDGDNPIFSSLSSDGAKGSEQATEPQSADSPQVRT